MNPRFLGAVVLACLLAFGLAGTASAHAELVESDPADGETIQTPYGLTASFSEELDAQNSRIVVRNAGGEEVARGGVSVDDEQTMTVELPELAPGDYIARWTAVTPDDQGVTRGTIDFTVAAMPTAPPPTVPPPTTSAPGTQPPTPSPSPTASPSPAPSSSPAPGEGEPTAGMSDVLLALVLAGAVVGGLSLYLFRRR